jgi:hypothetical protein
MEDSWVEAVAAGHHDFIMEAASMEGTLKTNFVAWEVANGALNGGQLGRGCSCWSSWLHHGGRQYGGYF